MQDDRTFARPRKRQTVIVTGNIDKFRIGRIERQHNVIGQQAFKFCDRICRQKSTGWVVRIGQKQNTGLWRYGTEKRVDIRRHAILAGAHRNGPGDAGHGIEVEIAITVRHRFGPRAKIGEREIENEFHRTCGTHDAFGLQPVGLGQRPAQLRNIAVGIELRLGDRRARRVDRVTASRYRRFIGCQVDHRANTGLGKFVGCQRGDMRLRLQRHSVTSDRVHDIDKWLVGPQALEVVGEDVESIEFPTFVD